MEGGGEREKGSGSGGLGIWGVGGVYGLTSLGA